MIQLLSWNCQGLGRALTIQNLGDLTHAHASSVLFLCETKQLDFRVNQIRRQFGFYKGRSIKPIDSAGGLTFWWKPDVNVEFLFSSKYFIDTVITVKCDGYVFRATWFYGPSYRADKAYFWQSISHLSTNHSCPWICSGDFNEILDSNEKEGGVSLSWNRPHYLQNFMNCNDLVDIGFCGQKYTWENRRETNDLIRERLDRALVNCHWFTSWLDSSVIHSARIGSDHFPLIINHVPPHEKSSRSFKFEAMWVDDPKCGQIIQQEWRLLSTNNSFISWNMNLAACKKALDPWSKRKFPNNRKLINSISSELSLVQACNLIDRIKENELSLELSRLWDLEETY
ncbi:hypothetical protein M0R45_015996 [Rubus argutus]|uniref:Endonuclease/exonuclease/phosphatase domain-containing protein n=1 Tax=Rubus argutus TaxID=59490 RepID=A0AAW1XR84_RUBAR